MHLCHQLQIQEMEVVMVVDSLVTTRRTAHNGVAVLVSNDCSQHRHSYPNSLRHSSFLSHHPYFRRDNWRTRGSEVQNLLYYMRTDYSSSDFVPHAYDKLILRTALPLSDWEYRRKPYNYVLLPKLTCWSDSK